MPKCGRSTVAMFLMEPVALRPIRDLMSRDHRVRELPKCVAGSEYWVCSYCYSRLIEGEPIEPPKIPKGMERFDP